MEAKKIRIEENENGTYIVYGDYRRLLVKKACLVCGWVGLDSDSCPKCGSDQVFTMENGFES